MEIRNNLTKDYKIKIAGYPVFTKGNVIIMIICGLFLWWFISSIMPEKEQLPTGIIQSDFERAVDKKIYEMNRAGKLFEKGAIEVFSNNTLAIVELYVVDVGFWMDIGEFRQRDLIKSVGDSMESLAYENCYPDTEDDISVTTIFYSPAGVEIGERTQFGNAKVK